MDSSVRPAKPPPRVRVPHSPPCFRIRIRARLRRLRQGVPPLVPVGGQKSGPNTRSAVRGRNDLILENLLLRHQLQVALRPSRRLSLPQRDRLFWVLVRRILPDWRRYLLFVRPEAVIRWHRRGWRWYWQWRSRTRLGRPRRSAEVPSSSRGWPARTDCGEPSGFEASCSSSASSLVPDRSGRYRRPQTARPASLAWRTFLHNEIAGIWAVDLLVLQTLTFKTLFVLFLIEHARRHLVHFNVTGHPTVAWVWQQLRERHAGGPAAAGSDS